MIFYIKNHYNEKKNLQKKKVENLPKLVLKEKVSVESFLSGFFKSGNQASLSMASIQRKNIALNYFLYPLQKNSLIFWKFLPFLLILSLIF